MNNGDDSAVKVADDRKRVTILMEEDVHELGVALARSDKRSFSRFLECLIEAEAKRQAEHKPEAAA